MITTLAILLKIIIIKTLGRVVFFFQTCEVGGLAIIQKRILARFGYRLKGKVNQLYVGNSGFFFSWRIFATWRKFSQKMCVPWGEGGGVEMIFLV
jgi:hypothetical protein